MNAHQMVCHLNDSFLAVMGEKQVSTATGPFQRTVVKWVALYAPFPWPKGVPTRPEMDQFAGGSEPSEFERDNKALLIAIAGSRIRSGISNGPRIRYLERCQIPSGSAGAT